MVSVLLIVVFAGACVVGLIALLFAFWNAVRATLNLKPEVDTWASGNPFNHLLNADALSPAGLVARARLAQSLAVFGASLLIALVVGILVKVYEHAL